MRPTGPGPEGHPTETGVAVAVGAFVVLGAWVWCTGELAARFESGRWLTGPAVATVAVLLRIPGHLGDLRQAWPPDERGRLPGETAFVLLGVATAVMAVATVLAGFWVWRKGRVGIASGPRYRPGRPAIGPGQIGRGRRPRPSRSSRRRKGTGARWATSRDLRSLTVRAPEPGRLVIGKVGRRLLATELRHSLLVFGPTQSGKTSGLAIPALLEWKGPVVATSVKGDLATTTVDWRRRQGDCWIFDPTGSSGLEGAGWSPLAEAGDWSGAQRVAGWMVDATPARGGLSEGAFWFAAAAKQLAPLLLAARCGALNMAAVVRWTNSEEWEHPAALLEGAGEQEALVALMACQGRDDRIRSSVGTTLETVLAPFEDPAVAAATARADIDPGALLEGPNTLYLCGPSFEQGRLQGLFASLVSSVVAAAVERAGRAGGTLDPPLLLVLDEVANIAPIRDLDTLASTGAGLGIQLVTVCQDLGQLTARYGAERAGTVANNHRAKLMLSGVADLGTLDLMSGLAGEAALREETLTHDLRDGRKTRASSVSFRRLAPADELRRIHPGEGVAIYGHLPATRVRLRPWFADRTLRSRGAAPGA